MSNVEKIGTQIGQICVGLSALMLGDASGGTLAAQGLVGLAAIGAALHGQSSKRACAKAQSKAIAALKTAPEFNAVNLDRLSALLESETKAFTRADLIDASKNAANLDLDAELARRLHAALPFDGDDAATKHLLLLALEAGMRACNADESFKVEVKALQLLHILQEVTVANRKLEILIAQSGDKARELHLTEQLFISLARRIAKDVDDIDQAHRELEHVVEVAADKHAKDTLPANTDDAITTILARVDTLNTQGQIDSAAALIAEEESRSQAGLFRLYDKGIAQAILTRDVDAACAYELKKLSLDTPAAAAQVDALRAVFTSWYERGRDKGLNFDLEVSIALARASLARARGEDQLGIAGNDLGVALTTLGERESGTDRLEQAVTACRAALEELTRDRAPLDWARTQMNLGNALATLGQRESCTNRLEQAVTAYRAALEELTRDRAPLGWAMAQMNLGTTLTTLGQRESGTDRLDQAVTAFRAALEEWTRDRAPLDRAMAQMNLGAALQTLGERESGTDRLDQAVTAYRAALEEWTRDRAPLDWAMAQMNLGNALQTLGQRESGTERLQEAVTAYRAALEEWARDRVPLDWAMTQMNLGAALTILGERESGTDRLDQVVTAFRAALEEYTRDRVPLNWARAQMNLGNALTALGERETGTDRLDQAVTAYRAALQEWTRERVPLKWAMLQGNLCNLEIAFFDKNADPTHLDAAQSYLDAAREVFAEAGASQYLGMCDAIQAKIDARRL